MWKPSCGRSIPPVFQKVIFCVAIGNLSCCKRYPFAL